MKRIEKRLFYRIGAICGLALLVTNASAGVRDVTTQTATAAAANNEVEDPILGLFGSALSLARAGKWPDLARSIGDDRTIKRLDALYDADCHAMILQAVREQKGNELGMHLAHTVYLGMRENLDAIVRDDFKNFRQNEALFKAAKDRYERVLSGNVKKKDEAIHTAIMRSFAKAQVAMGQVGVEADRAAFIAARDEIVASIKRVYTYFNEKK